MHNAITMFLTHQQYIRFLQGGFNNTATIAFLPGDLAAQMPTLSTDIKFDGGYARKIWEKHKLGHEILGLIQTMINDGWCTKSRPGQLDFLYVDDRTAPKYYVLGIKSTKQGQETWITTLHPTDKSDTNRRLRKARKNGWLIRNAVWS